MLGLLHYAVLYYAMLYFAIVLHYAMLNKAMLYYTILYVKVPPHGWRKVDHVKHRWGGVPRMVICYAQLQGTMAEYSRMHTG